MPLFYFHLRDHTESVLDPEGVELPDLAAVSQKALTHARELISHDAKAGLIDMRFRIDAEDEGGNIVHSVPFEQALTIIPADQT